ncbi:MAG: Rab family GTPase [Candidatus Helarchaeota archaeon]
MSKIYIFKICVIGDPGVGKTSLINRFSEHKFEKEYKPTLGANILIKDMKFDDNSVKFLIFDIAGQARWNQVRKLYYKGAQGSLLVYDVTRPNTISSITNWNKELIHNTGEIPKVLIANKIDLEKERKVTSKQGEQVASELSCSIFETSALNGTKVNDAFNAIALKLIKK